MSEGISYDFKVEGKFPGMPQGVQLLKDAGAAVGDLAGKTKSTEDELSTLQRTLANMKKPGDIARLKDEIANFGKKVPIVSEGFKGVGHEIDSAKTKLSGFLEFTGAIIAVEMVKKLTESVINLGGEILKAAGEAERVNLAMNLTVGNEGGEKILHWLDQIASKTRFTDGELKGWSNQLLRAGVAMKDVDKFISAGLDLNARGGDMGTAIDALTAAQRTGKIGTRQLAGLGIGVNQLKELPEFKGLNQDQLYKKIEAGSITKAQLFKLIAGEDGKLGDLGLQAGNTFEAKLKNLKTLPDQYFSNFANSPAFDALKDKMGTIFESLDPTGPRGAKIFASMERSFTKIVDIVLDIDFESVANTIETKVLPTIEKVAGVVKTIAGVVGFIVEHLGDLANAVKLSASPVTGVLDAASAPIKGLKAVGNYLGGMFSDGLAFGIAGGSPGVAGAATKIAGIPSDVTKDKNEIQSPSKVFQRLGQNVAAGFALGITGGSKSVEDAMGGFSIPESSGSGGGSARMVSLSIGDIHVSGAGQNGRQIGAEIVDHIRPIFQSMLLDSLEEAAATGGG